MVIRSETTRPAICSRNGIEIFACEVATYSKSSGEHNDAINGSSVGRHNFEEMINYATWESIPNKGMN
ncbi:hypothetical protein PVAP13_8KG127500 [Panicum virgatum]|uniref:Uncharacterized protein n=1 Tax=Panicum virgatum TaxID=38727 RepID=A0A8T0PMB0_PANVG|nr:hypothetical protein PVAP13_8KG127500 [Panicum virgatum]